MSKNLTNGPDAGSLVNKKIKSIDGSNSLQNLAYAHLLNEIKYSTKSNALATGK